MEQKIVLNGDRASLMTFTQTLEDGWAWFAKPIDFELAHLYMPIELNEVTLSDLLNWVFKKKHNISLIQQVFNYPMSGFPIEAFLEQAAEPLVTSDDGMTHLEIFWYSNDEDGLLEMEPGFHGWGKWRSEDLSDVDAEVNVDNIPKIPIYGGFCVSFSHLCDLMNYPLKLNNEVVVGTHRNSGYKELYRGRKNFRLTEVLYAILFEITFHGIDKKIDL